MKKIKVLIVGKSNVGKSSLINYFSNKHSALVSNKLHATRISTSHLINYNNLEIEFFDTPGASISDTNLLSKAMKSNSSKHLANSDIIILLTQPQEKYDYEIKIKDQIKESKKQYILCVNKTDIDLSGKYKKNLFKSLGESEAIFISVTESIGIELLYTLLVEKAASEGLESLDEINYEKNNINIIQELIRESLINRTNKELPYETAVCISDYKEQSNSHVIKADIIVSKNNHKKIIIGKKGQMIKNIGIKSRELIENYLGKKIHLSLFVVVKDNWKNNPTILKDIGYID
ncbi:GTPase Era [Gammaproteobacteria bacterium]|nr:GTPase Era [Gammaproteobacteria bacterium]